MAQRQWRSDDTDKWKYGFGKGGDGSTYAVPANAGCSGTSGGTSLTLDSASSFANGKLVLIHQSRGTGVGNWELNKIASGGGTTSITLAHDLQNTYTDSGASQAQIIELKEYENLTVSTTVTVPAWDGNKGGIIAFLDKGTTTISGQLNANGSGGGVSQTASNGGGFRGGTGGNTSNSESYQGEGTSGAGSQTNSANENGGGGGRRFTSSPAGWGGSGGGGGAGGAAGSTASTLYGGAGGTGGSVVSTSELTTLAFGGGGGGAGGDSNVNEDGGTGGGNGGAGGNGGGIILIISKELVVTGTITADGGQGRSNGFTGSNPNRNHSGTGGGGGGGSILLKCANATLGSTLLDALAGAAGSKVNGSAGGLGAAGGAGRIHLDYSGSYTGTTSPTIDARKDKTISTGSPLKSKLIMVQQQLG